MGNWGIPYMGSKSDIISSLALNFPKAENFYDLFGGGACVSHYLLAEKPNWYKNFFYNEIEQTTVQLIQDVLDGKYKDFKPPWVSREEFFAKKDTDAYTRLIWSFGNNQRCYIFGQDIELYKKSLHQAVVFDEFDDTARQVTKLNRWPKNIDTIKQRRLYISQRIKFDMPHSTPTELLQLQQLQHLQRLERLERLEQLERKLTTTALDYREVTIKPDSVVYCDIPYKGTASYVSTFNHSEFYEWARTRDFPVFISEYQMPDDFKAVYTIKKKTKLSGKGMTAHHDEKLYWNGVVAK